MKKITIDLILITSESVRLPDIRKWSEGHFKKNDAQQKIFGMALKKPTTDWGKISKEFKILYKTPGETGYSYSYMNNSMTKKPHPYNISNSHTLCDYALYMPDKKSKRTEYKKFIQYEKEYKMTLYINDEKNGYHYMFGTDLAFYLPLTTNVYNYIKTAYVLGKDLCIQYRVEGNNNRVTRIFDDYIINEISN